MSRVRHTSRFGLLETPSIGRGWALGTILLILIVLAMGCENGEIELPSPSPTPEPLAVTTTEIWDAYRANEARANHIYKNRPLNLTFHVDEIEDDYVIEYMEGFFNMAQLDFEQKELVLFNIGDKATAICRLRGLDLDTWLRFDCRDSNVKFHVATPASASTPTQAPAATPTSVPKVRFGPGTYQVNIEIQPGIYAGKAGTDILDSCDWQRLSSVSGEFSDIIATGIAVGQFYVEILSTDMYFKIGLGCNIVPLAEWPEPAELLSALNAGLYLVGRDIPSGTYRGKAGTGILDSCHWERLSGVSGEFSDIIAVDIATGPYFVSVEGSDFALFTACALKLVDE